MPDTKRIFLRFDVWAQTVYRNATPAMSVFCACVSTSISGSVVEWSIFLHNMAQFSSIHFYMFSPTLSPKPSFQHLFNHIYDFVLICHNWSDNRSFHCCPGDKWVLQRKGSVHLTFTWWCSWIVIPFVVRDIVLRGLSGSHSINFHLAISSPCEWQVRASSIVRTNGNLDFQGLGYFLPGLGTLVSVWKKLYLCKTNLCKVSWKWALLVH